MCKEAICITGYGFITPMGYNRNTLLESYADTNFTIKEDEKLSNLGLSCKKACRITKPLKELLAEKKAIKLMSRPAQLAEIAARDALCNSGLLINNKMNYDPFEIGIYMGVGLLSSELEPIFPLVVCSSDEDGKYDHERFVKETIRKSNPLQVLHFLSGLVASHCSIRYSIKGPNVVFNSYYAGSVVALQTAVLDLMEGNVRYALVGGSDDLVNYLAFTTYANHGILEGDSFIPSEGAAVIVLETEGSATHRKADILGKIEEIYFKSSVRDFHETGMMNFSFPSDSRVFMELLDNFRIAPDEIILSSLPTHKIYPLEKKAIEMVFSKRFEGFCIKGKSGELGAAQPMFDMILPILLKGQETSLKDKKRIMINSFGFTRTQSSMMVRYET